MASISTDSKGNRRILFMLGRNNRKVIRLGKVSMFTAQEMKRRVAFLAIAAETGIVDRETADWLSKRDQDFYDKLAAVGLVPARAKPERKLLGAFIDDYLGKKTGKPRSHKIWNSGKLDLTRFFGPNKPLVDITPGDADDYLQNLKKQRVQYSKPGDGKPIKTLSPQSIKNRLKFAKMIFRAAMRHKSTEINPFEGVNIEVTAPDRKRFISREDTAKLLDACPNQDWRLIVVLCRYGGLRCASEVLSVTWEGVDWKEQTIVVPSPKTEHHARHDKRTIPMFPELRSELEAVWTPESTGYIVDEKHRKQAIGSWGWSNGPLRQQFEKIIKLAGLKAWPRPFHNLRSSRQTELQEQFPMHVVCAWLGNSINVANDHYLQVTAEHLRRATAAQNQAQQPPAKFGNAEQPIPAPVGISRENPMLPTTAQALGNAADVNIRRSSAK